MSQNKNIEFSCCTHKFFRSFLNVDINTHFWLKLCIFNLPKTKDYCVRKIQERVKQFAHCLLNFFYCNLLIAIVLFCVDDHAPYLYNQT